jgi:hypothetical protein
MSPMQVLKMPLKTFWSANKQIDRLQAEQDQRTLQLLLAAQSGDGAKDTFEALRAEVDTPMLVIKGFDEARFLEMQQKFNKQ